MTGDGAFGPTDQPTAPYLDAIVAYGFDDETRASVTPFQRLTVLALFLLGLSCLWALIRSKVQAHPDRLVVVNGYRRRTYAWAEIVAVRLSPGAPWASLDLADGTSASVLGIQGSDGARAKLAVRQLRLLLDSAHAPGD